MEFGLIGKRLNYSFSKTIHDMLNAYDYQLCEIAPENLDDFMRRRDFKGFNVTIPYKKAVMPYLDIVEEPARSIGAVNTVYFKDGRLHGTNTDYMGFLWMAQRAGVSFTGRKVLIAGTGGAGIMARRAAEDQGASEVLLAGRKGPVRYEEIPSDIQVYVNATPVGTYPDNGRSNIELDRFPKLEGVLDLIYNPDKTALLLEAEKRRLPFSCGLPMLVAQATAAAGFFTGETGYAARNEEILRKLQQQTRNITLVGMPGCGKSTIGRRLARELGMTFCDTDEIIEKTYGRSAADIIRTEGERAFRDKESAVLAKVTKEHGQVIATGGGAVLRTENRDAMRQNGPVFFLSRRLYKLATKGRPLSVDLRALYKKRLPLYKSCSDFTIANEGGTGRTVRQIQEHL